MNQKNENTIKIFTTDLKAEKVPNHHQNGSFSGIEGDYLVEIKNYNTNLLDRIMSILNKLIIRSCSPVKKQKINKILIFILLSVFVWLITFILFDKEALPGGAFFSLAVLVFTSHIFGFIFAKIKLPALLGMLIVGIIFKNVPTISIVGKSIPGYLSSVLR